MDLADIIAFPKMDLHRHLDGDVKPEVLFRWAKKTGFDLPVKNPEELFTHFQNLKNRGLDSLFTEGFGLVTALLQTEENLEEAAYEEVRNLSIDGIVYGEIRFAPQYHTGESEYYAHSREGKKLTYRKIMEAVHRGLARGKEDFGVETKIIVCIGREISPQAGVDIAKAALESQDLGVVGIDLACDEASFPPARHQPAYQLTFGTSLKRTVHAGECTPRPKENMEEAIHLLCPHRLSHTIALHKFPDLQEKIFQNKIGLEMCPASNLYCGFIESYRDLKIDQFLHQNFLVTIHSDDPAMFGFTLSQSLHTLIVEYNWGVKELRHLQLNALEIAFLEEKEKKKLREKYWS